LWQKFLSALDAFWKSHQGFVDLAKAGGTARSADQDAQLKDQAATEDSQRIALGGILDQIIALDNSKAAAAVTAAEATSAGIRLIALIGLVAGPVLALLLGVAWRRPRRPWKSWTRRWSMWRSTPSHRLLRRGKGPAP
jgi:hypothetical protein